MLGILPIFLLCLGIGGLGVGALTAWVLEAVFRTGAVVGALAGALVGFLSVVLPFLTLAIAVDGFGPGLIQIALVSAFFGLDCAAGGAFAGAVTGGLLQARRARLEERDQD